MKCLSCKGKGTVEVTMHTLTNGQANKYIQHWGCPRCDDGVMSLQQRAEFEAHMQEIQAWHKMWCQCRSKHTRFYDDGEHPEIHKHHWRCRSCGKIVQIG